MLEEPAPAVQQEVVLLRMVVLALPRASPSRHFNNSVAVGIASSCAPRLTSTTLAGFAVAACFGAVFLHHLLVGGMVAKFLIAVAVLHYVDARLLLLRFHSRAG